MALGCLGSWPIGHHHHHRHHVPSMFLAFPMVLLQCCLQVQRFSFDFPCISKDVPLIFSLLILLFLIIYLVISHFGFKIYVSVVFILITFRTKWITFRPDLSYFSFRITHFSFKIDYFPYRIVFIFAQNYLLFVQNGIGRAAFVVVFVVLCRT